MSVNEHQKWMMEALLQAEEALKLDEVPVGAVIVKDNHIIGRGFNQLITQSDPSAHAEMVALRDASSYQNNYRLPECDIYVTLEPCMMCLGAMVHARIRKLYFATTEPKAGVICSQGCLHEMPFLNHRMEVEAGILKDDASNLLSAFFKNKRAEKKA
jgi:tRNA(adenine34) deaminase